MIKTFCDRCKQEIHLGIDTSGIKIIYGGEIKRNYLHLHPTCAIAFFEAIDEVADYNPKGKRKWS